MIHILQSFTNNDITQIITPQLLIPLILSIFAAIIAIVIPLFLYKQLNKKLQLIPKNEQIKKIEERINNLEKNFNEISTKIDEANFQKIKEEINKINETLNKISIYDKKITELESQIEKLKKPVLPIAFEEIKEVEINSLQELQVYYPFIKYASIITSQGFIIENIGKIADEPAKLLEIIKISDMFAGSKEIMIEKQEDILYLFYMDTLEDLDIYGIILAKKPSSINSFTVLKKVLINYFSKKRKIE